MAIDRLSIIWKSDLTDKMKRSFFQAVVVLILLYGCTTWKLTKQLEKKLDGNYTRMLRAILNKSWRQHPRRHQLYGHLPPITKTIQVRRTTHAGHMAKQKQDDQLELTYSSYVKTQDVTVKTCRRRWMIGRSGERWSGMMMMIKQGGIKYHFLVFGMTRTGSEPLSPRLLENTLLIRPLLAILVLKINVDRM